jgi:glycolate oxidase iron-sulfur subunit
MQIVLGARERGMELEVLHPVQLLDEAYRSNGVYTVPLRNGVAEQKQRQALLLGIGIGIVIATFLLRRRAK